MNPISAPIHVKPPPQCGVAAIELAIILCLTAFVLPTIFLFGRVFLQYNVLKQATQDAANYVASIPMAELRNTSKAAAATTRAQQMVTLAIAEAGITPSATLGSIFVYCNNVETCGPARPDSITVTSSITINGADFNAATWKWIDEYFEWRIPARSTVTYAN